MTDIEKQLAEQADRIRALEIIVATMAGQMSRVDDEDSWGMDQLRTYLRRRVANLDVAVQLPLQGATTKQALEHALKVLNDDGNSEDEAGDAGPPAANST